MNQLFFHPKLVHLPVALGLIIPLVATGLLICWWRDWLPKRTWIVAIALQALLVGAGFVTIDSGEDQAQRVAHVVAKQHIHEHAERAETYVWFGVGVLAVMLLAGIVRHRRSSLALATIATLGTLVGVALDYRAGEAGGDLVYRYGAAQAYTGVISSQQHAGGATGDHEHHD